VAEWHGLELDAAMAAAGAPDELGICPTALDSRRRAMIDAQLETLADPAERADTARLLAEQGLSTADESVDAIMLRGAIGGSWTLGLAAGLALAKVKKRDVTPPADGRRMIFVLRPTRTGWEVIGDVEQKDDGTPTGSFDAALPGVLAALKEQFPTAVFAERFRIARGVQPNADAMGHADEIRRHVDG
jgi:hypothetical protein